MRAYFSEYLKWATMVSWRKKPPVISPIQMKGLNTVGRIGTSPWK